MKVLLVKKVKRRGTKIRWNLFVFEEMQVAILFRVLKPATWLDTLANRMSIDTRSIKHEEYLYPGMCDKESIIGVQCDFPVDTENQFLVYHNRIVFKWLLSVWT